MRLKSFQAKTMAEAMRQIKETLGDDAIIVSTKEEPSGWVRITAAVEQANPTAEHTREHLRIEEEGFDDDTVIEMITDTLLKHRVPSSVSDKIITSAMSRSTGGDPQTALARAIGNTFTFGPLESAKIKRPVMLVGPPGAGKTLMTAKLAAKYVMDGKKTAVITTDIARAGGIEQLTAFLDILSLPLQQADDAKTLKNEIAKAAGASHVIVDTGGLNPFDPNEMKLLAKLIAVADMDTALVLPAGIDAEEAAEMAMAFSILGVKKFIPTRLDFARRLGGVLSAADKSELTFAVASHTPQVANGTLELDAVSMAELLMPHKPTKDSTKRGKK